MAGVTSPASPLYVHGMSLASDEEMGQLRECNQATRVQSGNMEHAMTRLE